MSTTEDCHRLSMRGGTMVLKGVTKFLAGARPKIKSSPTHKPKSQRKKMGKDMLKCSPKIIEAAKRDTKLNRIEIEALYKIFKSLVTSKKRRPSQDKNNVTSITKPTVHEGIDRNTFRDILHNSFDIVTENMIMDRIFCVWDKLNCGLITLHEWFIGISLFLRGTSDEITEFCFAVYDLNADGFITKDEMFQLLKNSLIKYPQEEDPDESIKDLVDIVLKKMDKDKDCKISLLDYKETLVEEPLLLQAFGTCLPSLQSKETFLSTLK